MESMEEENDCIEEVEFVEAIKQLRKVHRSRVVELQDLYDQQVHLNVQVKEEVEQLRDKVKKLKSVVHASKIKISQQAQIIAEQTILLRKARSPSAFQLSELYRDSEQDQYPDTEQTTLPSPPSKPPDLTTKTEAKPDTSTKPPVHRHMIYSHAHNNLDRTSRTNGANESNKRNKSLSLKGEEGIRVRYKERGYGNKSTTNQNPGSNNGIVSDPEDAAGTDSGGDSRAGSPSFLTDPSNLNTSWECAGTKNNPMEVDEPMSCSMFHTYVQTSTFELKDLKNTSTSTPNKKRKLEEIAERLNSSKKARELPSLKKSWTDPNILPGTPERKSKTANPNIVPITPGVKPVDLILNGKKNSETVKGGKADETTKSSKTGKVELRGASDENKVTLASDIPRDSLRKSKRLAGNVSKSTNLEGNEAAIRVAKRMGLPTDYKCETKILKKSDRDKLDAKACPDCKKWYDGDQPAHLKRTCRHKHLHLPPDSDSRMWDISFPNTEDYES